MMKYRLLFIAIFGITVITSCMERSKPANTSFQKDEIIRLPEGFTAYVVADSLGRGRHIAVRDNGDIYVSLSRLENGHGIVALRDTNNDITPDIIEYFGNETGTGIKIHKGYLYFASNYKVMRYKFSGENLLPDTTPELMISGFLKQNQHQPKTFTFDTTGNIYVNIGAPSNACMEQTRTPGSPGIDPCPQLQWHAGIWRFKDDMPDQDLMKNGYRYATGIRNAVAINWNLNRNHLYIVQHGRDQLSQFFPEYFSEDDGVNLPAEEFLLLEDGSDCGWPYCYYNPKTNKKLLAPEYGGNGIITGRCEDKTDPIMAFPAHYAPNDLIFYSGQMFPEKYQNGAFIAFHGSWNRGPQEQKGYDVVFVPFNGDYPSGNWAVFADGFSGKDKIMSPADALYRPCGLAQGADGSLYVVDSRQGKVWKIIYSGK